MIMEIPYQSFVHSQPFQFLIGPEKRSVYIHSGLVEEHSETLATLVGGRMTEAKNQCGHLEDIDVDTFIRFVEFAYTGDYSVPKPELDSVPADKLNGPQSQSLNDPESGRLVESVLMTPPSEGAPQIMDYDIWGFSKKTKTAGTKKTKRSNRWVESRNDEIEFPPEPEQEPGFGIERPRESKWWREFKSKARPRELPAWEPRENKRTDEDYGPIFICHASLYVFSDRYSIEPLQELVLQKLRLTLSRFILFRERIADVVELLKYTYANTMDHDEGIDKLRNLVTDYVVCKIQLIATNPDFLQFMKEDGSVAKDIMVKLVERLAPESSE